MVLVLLVCIKVKTINWRVSLVLPVNIQTRTNERIASLVQQVTFKVELEVRAVLLVLLVSIKIRVEQLAAALVGRVCTTIKMPRLVAKGVGLENTARAMLAPTTAIYVKQGITKIKKNQLVASNVLLANMKVEAGQRLPAAKVTVHVVTIAQPHQQILKLKIVEPEIIAPQVPVVELLLEEIRELQQSTMNCTQPIFVENRLVQIQKCASKGSPIHSLSGWLRSVVKILKFIKPQ